MGTHNPITDDEVYQNFKKYIEIIYVWKDKNDYFCMFELDNAWIETPIAKGQIQRTLDTFIDDNIYVEIGKP